MVQSNICLQIVGLSEETAIHLLGTQRYTAMFLFLFVCKSCGKESRDQDASILYACLDHMVSFM